MKYYNNEGLWNTAGWWNSGNCLTSLLDYMRLTGTKTYLNDIVNTFDKGRHHAGSKDFTNDYIDDTGWWGLAWVRAFDLTNEQKYLDMAKYDADYMYSYHDNVCKGGLWWNNQKGYKNAITNELFIKLAASLHNRIKGDEKYLGQAVEVYNWFKGTGMINGEHLINDGLDLKADCKPAGATYTYNQGVILGGLVELYKAKNEQAYLDDAKRIADAITKSGYFNKDGVLVEGVGEGDGCTGDGPSFKGIFMRNLGELNRELKDRPYQGYINKVADSAYNHARNAENQYGNKWLGPFKETAAACQHGALDLLNSVF